MVSGCRRAAWLLRPFLAPQRHYFSLFDFLHFVCVYGRTIPSWLNASRQSVIALSASALQSIESTQLRSEDTCTLVSSSLAIGPCCKYPAIALILALGSSKVDSSHLTSAVLN